MTRWCCAAAHLAVHASYAGVTHSPVAPALPAELEAHIDWATTASLRLRLAARGVTIAEAMDTAQRQYLGWPLARELIRRTGEQRLVHGFVAGAGAEQAGPDARLSAVVDAVVEQGHFIRAQGGEVALLPLLQLAVAQAGASEYEDAYGAIARQLGAPLILHRLGSMFLPLLRTDFPGDSFRRVLRANAEQILAVKYSLLDPEGERALRRELLPRDQFVLTGDDWNFGELMCGTAEQVGSVQRTTHFGPRRIALGDFSHALLGILDVIAAPVMQSLPLLDAGDARAWMARMRSLEALGRKLFEAPVGDYKAGLAHLAWLNGWQPNAMLLQHQERSRSAEHYREITELARAAGVLEDPARAAPCSQGPADNSR